MKKLLVVLIALFALLSGYGLNQYLEPDFETLNGNTYKWHNSQGEWTVVNYFAQWCAPCLRELPELNEFYHQYGDTIRLFAISYDAMSDDELLAMQKQHNIQFQMLKALKNAPWNSAPTGLPATYIISPDGKLMSQLKGEQTAVKLKQTIDRLKAL
ncbi:TlpA family protein disulfide reductase [Paraglaciecola sp. 2405UD69-4]|uniref:TlpA family protein disulfide reductase n=1 Tax=Paraglaciecola sp. 2405UD69-4 TaxID=3391836 RepID=UPI0039C99C21